MKDKELLGKIVEMVDGVLPSNVSCLLILLNKDTEVISTASDLPNDVVKFLLEDSLIQLEKEGDNFLGGTLDSEDTSKYDN